MGFGWLLIGYFVATVMTLNPIGSLIRVIGYGVVGFAAKKLNEYHRSFRWVIVGACAMLAVSACLAVSDVSDYFYQNLWLDARLISESGRTAIGYIEKILSFFFNGAMLWAIRAIAIETEVVKIATRAVRNFVFICLYELVFLVSMLPLSGVRAVSGELALIAWILYLVWIVLNLMLIFSCYAQICDEQDVDMEQKPSRFAFVNRFREENERRSQKAREEAAAYHKEKHERRRKKRK